MALNAAQQWWIRVAGDNTNGGGFDSTVAGAGTNYCDQDAAQLNPIDLTTSGANATTITSVVGGFTSAMVGNVIRIASGTNFTAGYYMIVTFTNGNNVVLDRTPTPSGAGVTGNGKVGGAFATFEPLMSTGVNGLNTPAIATPLAAGHTINVRGSGSDDPGSVDYDYKGSASSYQGYYTVVSGDTTNGRIQVVGYNGRPYIQFSGLLFHTGATYWYFSNLKAIKYATSGYTNFGFASTNTNNLAVNCVFDTNGIDMNMWSGSMIDCEVRNSGGGAAGTVAAVIGVSYLMVLVGCYIHDVRGDGVADNGNFIAMKDCIISKSGRDGIRLNIASPGYGSHIAHNTIDGNGGSGIRITTATAATQTAILNNILSHNGAYGINIDNGTVAANDRKKLYIDYNDFDTNTSGNVNGFTIGANSLTLDPQYVDRTNKDFRIGTNLKGKAWPGTFRGATKTISYDDMGAVQRLENDVIVKRPVHVM